MLNHFKKISLTLSLFILALCFGFLIQAWTGPTSAPPGDNLPRPINVGTDDQEKAGRISATEFYDADDPDYYINPSGASKVSGSVSIGGNLVDLTNSKTIYDASTGQISPLVMPYKKGAITSDWATTDYTAGYYDVSALSAENVGTGISYGRGQTGTKLGEPAQPSCVGKTGLQSISFTWLPNIIRYFCGSSSKMYSPTRSGALNWTNAVSYCNNLSLWGYTDWRLPDRYELREDFGNSACACVGWSGSGDGQSSCDLSSQCGSWDVAAAASTYWSSTESGSYAYVVLFNSGYVRTYNKTYDVYVRCVRG